MKKRTGILIFFAAVLLLGVVAYTIKLNRVVSQPAVSKAVSDQGGMFDSGLVAHALGGIDGYPYLNSKEGFEESYSRGMRFVEVDLYFSADGRLICSHGFKEADVERMGIEGVTAGNPPEYDEWNTMRFHDRYTTQNAEDILHYLNIYPELYVEFDMRSLKGEDAYRMAEALLEVFGTDRALFERILVQVYSPEMYEIFKEVYDFPMMQFYMTKAFCKDITTYIEFCETHEIVSIAISDSYVTDEILEKLLNSGIKIMVHTVDDPEKAQMYLDRGVTVICTNYLYYDSEGKLKSKVTKADDK